MKITKDLLRELITEEINALLSEETMKQQRDNAVDQISGILTKLHNTNINAQDVLNSSKDQYEKKVQSQRPVDMNQEDAIDEGCGDGPSISIGIKPANRKEKKWSDADHDKQEKIAKEIEKENPGISKEKKMAFAGAQVNREKRKRNK